MFHIVIRDQRYGFVSKRLRKGVYGRCDYADQRIIIRPGLSSANLIRTAAHETIHAVFEFLTEEAVLELEDALAEVLIDNLGVTVDPKTAYKRLAGKRRRK